MKKLQFISFHLHWITLCCFMLPFFYDSCATKKTEEISLDSAAVVVPIEPKDSTSKKTTSRNTATAITSDTSTNSSTNEELLSERTIKKYPISKLILKPTASTQSGFYTILNTIPFIPLFAATITCILLLVGLLAKLIDQHAFKTFLLLEICGVLFLSVSGPHLLFDYEIIWGYWLCTTSMVALITIDVYIVIKQANQTT